MIGFGVLPGGAKGTRTPDPLLAKQVLFQLSYSPARRRSKGTRGCGALAAGGTGLGSSPPAISRATSPIPSTKCVAPAARSLSLVCPPFSTPTTIPAPDRLPHVT